MKDRDWTRLTDANAHCLAAGLIARHCSAGEAWLAGWGKEFKDVVGRGDAQWRDLEADRLGRRCAREAVSDQQLSLCCEQAIAARENKPQ